MRKMCQDERKQVKIFQLKTAVSVNHSKPALFDLIAKCRPRKETPWWMATTDALSFLLRRNAQQLRHAWQAKGLGGNEARLFLTRWKTLGTMLSTKYKTPEPLVAARILGEPPCGTMT